MHSNYAIISFIPLILSLCKFSFTYSERKLVQIKIVCNEYRRT